MTTTTADKAASNGQVAPAREVDEAEESRSFAEYMVVRARLAAYNGLPAPLPEGEHWIVNDVFSDDTDRLAARFDSVTRAQDDNGDMSQEMMAAVCDVIAEAIWFGLTTGHVRVCQEVSVPRWIGLSVHAYP